MSTLRNTLTVDPPIEQTAAFRFDASALAAIDDKIRACEEHIVNSLIRGFVAPNFLVKSSTSNTALLTQGACFCGTGTTNGLEIDAATSANLTAQVGRIIGILATQGTPGGWVRGIVAGLVPTGITGLGAGVAGAVYVDGATARLTRTATAYPVGTCDTAGNALLSVSSEPVFNPYAVGIAGPSVSIPAGGSVVAFADPDFLQPWTAAGLSMSGVAVNGGTVGQSISVQSFGETAGINHALWAYKPTEEDAGSAVYAASDYKYTMTPSTTPGQYNQKIGIVWHADNEPLSDTTTILLNIQPPVIVPAS